MLPEPGRTRPALSVVIPAHNSADVIQRSVGRWTERWAGTDNEVIVVENGSTDNTAALVATMAAPQGTPSVVVLTSDKGMGNALRAGIAASTGTKVLLSADDLPFGFDDLDRAAALPGEPDVVIGSKAHPDSQVGRGMLRAVSTLGFRAMRRILLRSRVGDSQGTILANGDWLRAVAPHADHPGFLFTTQLCFAAESEGRTIVEVPVRLAADHAPKASTVRVSDVWAMGYGLLAVRRAGPPHATPPVARS